MDTKAIFSVGKACSIVNAMPCDIREAARALEVKPTQRIDGCDYYDESDVRRIGEHIRQQREGRQPRHDKRAVNVRAAN